MQCAVLREGMLLPGESGVARGDGDATGAGSLWSYALATPCPVLRNPVFAAGCTACPVLRCGVTRIEGSGGGGAEGGRAERAGSNPLSSYALATPCPVLPYGFFHAPTHFATHCHVLTYGFCCCPTHSLRAVRY
eukprot:2426821-Rhodomonas_salina.1